MTSLEVLAHAAYDAGASGQVVAVVDARRGEVFGRPLPGPRSPVAGPRPVSPSLADARRGRGRRPGQTDGAWPTAAGPVERPA